MTSCLVGLLVLILVAGGSPLRAHGPSLQMQIRSEPGASTTPFEPVRSLAGKRTNPALGSVIVRHVRLEPAPPIQGSPSALVRFDVHNQGSRDVADIDVKVFLLATSSEDHAPVSPTVLAGPFTIRTKRALTPGDRFDYEVRLRNLTSDCDCFASVDVVGARFVPEP